MSPRRSLYPAAAPVWLAGDAPVRILDLGSGNGAFAESLTSAGHEVFCIDRDVDLVSQLPEKLGTRLHIVGQVEALPFLSCHFDVVTASQTLHRFAPGLALSEIARVLRPGGHLAVAYNTRDDTVPWVKRLTALLKAADPSAMTGDFGADSVEAVADSPYFTQLERKNFRNWVPITRSGLIAMVERRPSTAQLEPEVREQLLRDVGELYDTSARAPEPLLLPFQASCWRARVDHSQLSMSDESDALQIRL
ncbi:MAG TPA: class I SAM-dependent methyltransferase [Propionibacteriaceae bacterium]|nr:class I SAM-dependent methyltransferase [Propionibacteriaceae bacterium]